MVDPRFTMQPSMYSISRAVHDNIDTAIAWVVIAGVLAWLML